MTMPCQMAATSRPGIEVPMPIDADLDHLAYDPALGDKIMKKRAAEIARRAKLHDLRKFRTGTDHGVLNDQINEKRATAKQLAAEEAYYAQSALLQDQILETVETMKAANARERHTEVIAYSLQNLAKEQRREYVLSDPNVLKTAALEPFGPQNKGDPKEEKKIAQKQQAQWLVEQIQEKKAREQAEKDLDRYYDDRMTVAAQVQYLIEESDKQEDKAAKYAEAAENLELAEIRRQKRSAQRQQDYDLKLRHVDTIKSDPGLAETIDWKVGVTGKLTKADYKRCSLNKEQDVYNTNARIILEKRLAKTTEKLDDRAEANHIATSVVVLGAVEEQKARMAKERQLKIQEENFKIAAERRQKQEQERLAYKAFDY